MAVTTPKDRLLEAVVESALTGGIADKSLRATAEAAGTSHRMLIHHFAGWHPPGGRPSGDICASAATRVR